LTAVLRVHGGSTTGSRWIIGPTLPVPTIWTSVSPGLGFATPYTAVSLRVAEPTYNIPVSGSNAPPSQSTPPEPGKVNVPLVPLAGRSEERRVGREMKDGESAE